MSDSAAHSPETWVDRHGDALYRFAIGRVHDPELAADLVQETFLEGLRARSSFSGNSSLRTWLIAILKHKILDWYRRSGRMPRAEADPLSEPAIEGFFDRRGHWKARPGRWGDDPGETLDRGEFWEVLGRCVARLPEHLADAFLAIELGDLGRDRVCEQLQITAANLAVRLYRARLLLRHCLETHWFAGAAPPAALTEKERRRLWNGYRGSFRAEATEVTNLAKVGPEFLLKIGQAPIGPWTSPGHAGPDTGAPDRAEFRDAIASLINQGYNAMEPTFLSTRPPGVRCEMPFSVVGSQRCGDKASR